MTNRKKIKWNLVGICLLAGVIRFLTYAMLVDQANLNGLTDGYVMEAITVINGSPWFKGNLNGNHQLLLQHPKGFSMLLALNMLLFKEHYFYATHILMIVLDSLVCVFLYWIALKLFDSKRVGILSAIVWAVNPYAIVNATQDLPDAFVCFFVVLMIYLNYRSYKDYKTKYITIGVVSSLIAYFRSEFMLVIGISLLYDWIQTKSLRNVILPFVLGVGCFLAVNTPWMLYSYQETGHVVMSSATAWGSAYEAIGEKVDNAWGIQLGDLILNQDAIDHGFDGAWTIDANSYYKEQFKKYVSENPKEYLSIVTQYRLPKAFMPQSYVMFNLNQRDGIIHDVKLCKEQKCAPFGVCMRSFKLARYFEGYSHKLSVIPFLLMICYIIQSFVKHRMKDDIYMVLMYLYFPLSISVLKQIEPRNVAGTLPILTLCSVYVIVYWVCKVFRLELNK